MRLLNITVYLLLLFCALSLVTAQQSYRILFNKVQKEKRLTEALDSEFDKFQIELENDIKSSRIERVASGSLGMYFPNAKRIESISPLTALPAP